MPLALLCFIIIFTGATAASFAQDPVKNDMPFRFQTFDANPKNNQIDEKEVTEEFAKKFLESREKDQIAALERTTPEAKEKLLSILIGLYNHAGNQKSKDMSANAIAVTAAKFSWEILKIYEKENYNILNDMDEPVREKVLKRFKGLYNCAGNQESKTLSANAVFLATNANQCEEKIKTVENFLNDKINLEKLNSADKLSCFSDIRYVLYMKKCCADASSEYRIKELELLSFPKSKYDEFENAVYKYAVNEIKKMPNAEKDKAKGLIVNALKFMNENLKYSPGGRGAGEFTAEKALADGTFNGCVEAAKIFMLLFTRASSGMPEVKCNFIHSFHKGWAKEREKLDPKLTNPDVWKNAWGHAVVEIQIGAATPFIVDATAFERIKDIKKEPVEFKDLEDPATNIIKYEKDGGFDDYIIYKKQSTMPKPDKDDDSGNSPSSKAARKYLQNPAAYKPDIE